MVEKDMPDHLLRVLVLYGRRSPRTGSGPKPLSPKIREPNSQWASSFEQQGGPTGFGGSAKRLKRKAFMYIGSRWWLFPLPAFSNSISVTNNPRSSGSSSWWRILWRKPCSWRREAHHRIPGFSAPSLKGLATSPSFLAHRPDSWSDHLEAMATWSESCLMWWNM